MKGSKLFIYLLIMLFATGLLSEFISSYFYNYHFYIHLAFTLIQCMLSIIIVAKFRK